MSDHARATVVVPAVVQPCLSRSVLLAREGQTVLYVVPGTSAAREARRILRDLGEGASIEGGASDIVSIGPGTLQILQVDHGDLVASVRGRVGLIILHTGLRYHEWRQIANAINGHRHGSGMSARADGTGSHGRAGDFASRTDPIERRL